MGNHIPTKIRDTQLYTMGEEGPVLNGWSLLYICSREDSKKNNVLTAG